MLVMRRCHPQGKHLRSCGFYKSRAVTKPVWMICSADPLSLRLCLAAWRTLSLVTLLALSDGIHSSVAVISVMRSCRASHGRR